MWELKRHRKIRLLGNIAGVPDFRVLGDEDDLVAALRKTLVEQMSLIRSWMFVAGVLVTLLVLLLGPLDDLSLRTRNTVLDVSRGADLCVSEFLLNEQDVTAIEAESGRLLSLDRGTVRAIRRDAC